jgi:hypothetical protein
MPTAPQRLLPILQQSFIQTPLTFSDLPQFRQQLSAGLNKYSSVYNSVFLGAQAATPGMAFLSGYQNTIRCLDDDCPADALAAFCVSEKGVKKPWAMTSQLTELEQGYALTGQKAYVMLLPNELDRLYVIAKNGQQLTCVFFSAGVKGLTTTSPLKAPFIEDIPHSGVRFDNVLISESQLMPMDGHQGANKPFRYWEDVHVSLAMMAWMARAAYENGKALDQLAPLTEQMSQLIKSFEKHPNYYFAESFSLLDQSQDILEFHSKYLSVNSQKDWQKDRLLLQMGQKIRRLVSAKMSL